MKQLNLRILSKSVASALHEISQLSNLLTLNQNRTLITKVEELKITIQGMLMKMRQKFTSIRQDLTSIQQKITTLHIDLTERIDVK